MFSLRHSNLKYQKSRIIYPTSSPSELVALNVSWDTFKNWYFVHQTCLATSEWDYVYKAREHTWLKQNRPVHARSISNRLFKNIK